MRSINGQKRRKDGLERQAHILDISLELFAEKGYHATSVEDIIKAGEMAKSTFYFHFKNKKEILVSLIDMYFPILYDSFIKFDISMKKPKDELKIIMLDIADSLVNVRKLRLFTKLILGEIIGMNAPFVSKVMDFSDSLLAMGTVYIKRAQDDGAVDPIIDPEITACNIIGGLKEILYRWLVKNETMDINAAIKASIDFYFKGLFSDTAS